MSGPGDVVTGPEHVNEPEPAVGPPTGPRAGAGAVAGLAAAALTLAVAHLAAAVVDPPASPLTAIGGAVVDATPEPLKEAAIAAFGVHDKTALLVGMLLVIAGVAALGGVLALRHARAAQGVVVALGLAAGAVALARPQTGLLAPLPSLLGALAGALTLPWLVRRAPAAAAPHDSGGPPPEGSTRRGFLRAVGAVGAAALVGAAVGAVVTGARSTAAAIRTLVLPSPARAAAPVPADAQAPVRGVVDVVTRNGDFYRIDTALAVPQVQPEGWRLRVHGLVEREVELTFDELLAADLVEAYVTLTCVSNPVGGDLAGNARWLGLPVRELLTRAGPLPDADMVLSRSADGFTASTPLEALTDGRDALLAVGMNGEPLPPEHGFPVRLVVPGLYGYVSATKWVVDLEVTRFADAEAYWTVRGWSERGPVKTASRIEVPREGATIEAGPVDVGGTAWAQHTGIDGVEVQVDDEPWQPATLAGEISVDTWRQWSWRWADAAPGDHVLRVRATDRSRQVQTAERAGVVPDGATGHHEVTVRVV